MKNLKKSPNFIKQSLFFDLSSCKNKILSKNYLNSNIKSWKKKMKKKNTKKFQ